MNLPSLEEAIERVAEALDEGYCVGFPDFGVAEPGKKYPEHRNIARIALTVLGYEDLRAEVERLAPVDLERIEKALGGACVALLIFRSKNEPAWTARVEQQYVRARHIWDEVHDAVFVRHRAEDLPSHRASRGEQK